MYIVVNIKKRRPCSLSYSDKKDEGSLHKFPLHHFLMDSLNLDPFAYHLVLLFKKGGGSGILTRDLETCPVVFPVFWQYISDFESISPFLRATLQPMGSYSASVH